MSYAAGLALWQGSKNTKWSKSCCFISRKTFPWTLAWNISFGACYWTQLDSTTGLNERTYFFFIFFSSFHSEKRKFAKGHKVELDALKEPLNGACCQIAFSAVVFKVKNISVGANLNTKATSIRIYSSMATWQAQPLMILLKVKCFFFGLLVKEDWNTAHTDTVITVLTLIPCPVTHAAVK